MITLMDTMFRHALNCYGMNCKVLRVLYSEVLVTWSGNMNIHTVVAQKERIEEHIMLRRQPLPSSVDTYSYSLVEVALRNPHTVLSLPPATARHTTPHTRSLTPPPATLLQEEQPQGTL